jgi:hypothetical protein
VKRKPLRLLRVREVPPGPEAEERLHRMWERLCAQDDALAQNDVNVQDDAPAPDEVSPSHHDTPLPEDDGDTDPTDPTESGPLSPGLDA